jgi:anaerobic magnesium-protoporphyrin IX monomethyl ester cyclase
MNLAFINPPGPRDLYRSSVCTFLSKARYVWKPKDFIILSSLVPADWKIQFIDASLHSHSVSETLEWAGGTEAQAFVVAASSITWERDLEFLRALRARFPNRKIFVFGEVFRESLQTRKALEYVDAILHDPSREKFAEIVEGKILPEGEPSRFHKDAKEITTHLPRHDLFDDTSYRWPFVKHRRFATVFTQFGCPFSCSYCPEALTRVSYRPSENILHEMESLKAQGYKELHIGDASFGYPRENSLNLLRGMIERRFKFQWSSYFHPAMADSSLLGLMAESGCHTLVVGIDSADESLLKSYGRSLSRSKLRQFVTLAHENKIQVCGNIVLGFEEETWKTCLETIDLLLDLNIEYASINIATPMLGSAIRERKKERGVIAEGSLGFDTAGLVRISETSHLSARELQKLRSLAIRRFYLRPSYLFKRLFRVKSIEELGIQLEEGWGIFSKFTA